MAFPSCNSHPYIPVPENCGACGHIVINLGIEEQPPDSTFSGTYVSSYSAQQDQPAENTTTDDQDDYPERFALAEDEREDADDYPERFALEEHEQEGAKTTQKIDR